MNDLTFFWGWPNSLPGERYLRKLNYSNSYIVNRSNSGDLSWYFVPWTAEGKWKTVKLTVVDWGVGQPSSESSLIWTCSCRCWRPDYPCEAAHKEPSWYGHLTRGRARLSSKVSFNWRAFWAYKTPFEGPHTLPHTLLPEQQRYKDTIMDGALGSEVPGQLT